MDSTALSAELLSLLQQGQSDLLAKIKKTQEKKQKNKDLKTVSRRQRENASSYRSEVKRKAEAEYISNMVSNLKNEKDASLDLVEKILLPQLVETFLAFCEEQGTKISGVKVILNCSKTNDSPDVNIVLENNPCLRRFHKPGLEKIKDLDNSSSEEAIVSLSKEGKLPRGWTLAVGKGQCSQCDELTSGRFEDKWLHLECSEPSDGPQEA